MHPELLRFLEMAADGMDRLRRGYAVWQPVTELPGVVRPFFALAAVLSVALLAGISLAALSTLLVSLLVLQFLLVDVFGLSLEMRPS